MSSTLIKFVIEKLMEIINEIYDTGAILERIVLRWSLYGQEVKITVNSGLEQVKNIMIKETSSSESVLQSSILWE